MVSGWGDPTTINFQTRTHRTNLRRVPRFLKTLRRVPRFLTSRTTSARGSVSASCATFGRIQAASVWKGPLSNCGKLKLQLENALFALTGLGWNYRKTACES